MSDGNKRRRGRSGAALGVESLEVRVLPAVDLIVSAGSMTVSADPPAGSNLYNVTVSITLKNLGTTPIDLTNVANDPTDNVNIQLYLSMDNVLDGGDSTAFSGSHFSLVDNGPHVIGQNEEWGVGSGRQFLARQTFNYLIFKVDYNDKVTESNENNNTLVVDAQAVKLLGGGGTVNAAPKATVAIDTSLTVRDLNTVNFNGGNFGVLVDGAQVKDKFLLKTGEGAERLRLAGKKLKLGATTIGTVTKVIPTAGNSFEMSLRVELTGEVSRDVLNRALRNLSFRPGAKSSGTRTVQFQVKDNLENFSEVAETTVQVG